MVACTFMLVLGVGSILVPYTEQFSVPRSTGQWQERTPFKRYDTSLLMANCGGLGGRCRYIPPGRCVHACVNGVVKNVCRLTPRTPNERRCLVGPIH